MIYLSKSHFGKLAATALGIAVIAGYGCDPGPSSPTATNTASTSGSSASCTPTTFASPPADSIPIGLVASLTGPQLPWGQDCLKGAQLAVDDFNKAGGLNGKQVNLISADDASKPEQGKSAVEKLIDQNHIIGCIGEVASGITLQMKPVLMQHGIPDIAVGATKDEITQNTDDIFRVCYTDSLQGPVMANFAYKKKGLRNVAVMTDKTQPYSVGLSKSFIATFTKLGGKIVDEEFYESGQTQFTGQLTQLKDKNPDGVFASGYFPEVGPMVRQAKEAGMNVPFFGGDGWDSKTIAELGGDAIIGDFYCNHYSNDEDTPEVKDFLKKWNTAFCSNPGTAMGALGYDATALMLDALKRAGSADPAKLKAAIASTDGYKGVTGTVTLKGMHGDPPKTAIIVQVEKDGTKFATAMTPDQVSR